MATMIVKHRVASFEKWKVVFDEMEATRREHGWSGHIVLRDATDPNVVCVVNRMATVEGAKAYGTSSALKEAMARAGVTSAPEIHIFDDADERRY